MIHESAFDVYLCSDAADCPGGCGRVDRAAVSDDYHGGGPARTDKGDDKDPGCSGNGSSASVSGCVVK